VKYLDRFLNRTQNARFAEVGYQQNRQNPGAEGTDDDFDGFVGSRSSQQLLQQVFAGTRLIGMYLIGTFKGPMVPIPDSGRCPKCTNTKHFCVIDGRTTCSLCAERGSAESPQDDADRSPTEFTSRVIEEHEIDRIAARDAGDEIINDSINQKDLFRK